MLAWCLIEYIPDLSLWRDREMWNAYMMHDMLFVWVGIGWGEIPTNLLLGPLTYLPIGLWP